MERSEAQFTQGGLFSSWGWGLAAISCAIGEIMLISLQVHFGWGLRSILFWYVPFAFTAPTVAGIGAIKRIRVKTHEPEMLVELSHEIGVLVSTANMTVIICIIGLLLKDNL